MIAILDEQHAYECPSAQPTLSKKMNGIYCSVCFRFSLSKLVCISVWHHTVYPKKYAHGFVVLCFVVVMQSFIMNSHEVFIHIHQGCFAGTGAIVRLPQCQWSKPDGYGKISRGITTTKHSKAKTVCIFLGIYCSLISGVCVYIISLISSGRDDVSNHQSIDSWFNDWFRRITAIHQNIVTIGLHAINISNTEDVSSTFKSYRNKSIQ